MNDDIYMYMFTETNDNGITLTKRRDFLQGVYTRGKYLHETLGIKEGGGCLINESTLLGAYDTYMYLH